MPVYDKIPLSLKSVLKQDLVNSSVKRSRFYFNTFLLNVYKLVKNNFSHKNT